MKSNKSKKHISKVSCFHSGKSYRKINQYYEIFNILEQSENIRIEKKNIKKLLKNSIILAEEIIDQVLNQQPSLFHTRFSCIDSTTFSCVYQNPMQLFKPSKNQTLKAQDITLLLFRLNFNKRIILYPTFQRFSKIIDQNNYKSQEYNLNVQLKQFCKVMTSAIIWFYKIKESFISNNQNHYFTLQNIMNFVISQIFKINQIYNVIIKLYSYPSQKVKNKILNWKDSNDIQNRQKNYRPVNFGVSQTSALKNQKQPYKKCINKIKLIEKKKTPIGMIKCIISCCQKIPLLIKEYQENNKKLDQVQSNSKKVNQIDGDQILNIMCYIIWKVYNEGVFIQKYLNIIERFLSTNMMTGMAGYYWSVTQAAINHLIQQFDR